MHTASLVITGFEDSSTTSSETAVSREQDAEEGTAREGLRRRKSQSHGEGGEKKRQRSMSVSGRPRKEVPIAVVEQRVSNLAQGALCELLSARTTCADAVSRPGVDD
jgi:hypothetical protein